MSDPTTKSWASDHTGMQVTYCIFSEKGKVLGKAGPKAIQGGHSQQSGHSLVENSLKLVGCTLKA